MDRAVGPGDAGARLDVFIAAELGVSRGNAQRLIELGAALVNGKPAAASRRLKPGDAVSAEAPPPEAVALAAEDVPLDVLYEDGDLIVINKPQGMVVHPAAGHAGGTLVNALMHRCGASLSGINGELRPGIVHRIDKDTSGALVCAKNDFAHTHLAAQFAAHTITRAYRAVVVGRLEGEGVIDKPLGRAVNDRKRFMVTPSGKRAVTRWRALEPLRGHTLVECRLETGRTHQIRVHMAHINRPVLGDPVYGGKCAFAPAGQALHAGVLGFVHPRTGEYVEFHAEEPGYWQPLLARLRQ